MVTLLIENIQLQLEGGAEVVMIFDPAAGELSPFLFQHFVAPNIIQIAKQFTGQVAYYSKETNLEHFGPHLLNSTDLVGIGVDHRQNVPELLKKRPSGFIQGNFDQALLFAEPAELKKRLKEFLTPFQNLEDKYRAGWVCGLGHGVLPQTPEDNVKIFIETVRETFK
jgi:uroporphyrinogen decarboxylase